MLEAIVMSVVLARGPDLPDVRDVGKKYHPSSVSMFQGELYMPEDNRIRLCIRDRESNDIYSAVSKPPKRGQSRGFADNKAATADARWPPSQRRSTTTRRSRKR